ncbi:MAG: hypothetical protein ACLFWL_13200 [Candidatus Brocadiia bacterium]
MDADAFAKIASCLENEPPSGLQEAAHRTAVGRIYYAAFLFAREMMTNWGCDFGSGGRVHAEVAEGLKCSGVRALWKIGNHMVELHDQRKVADYDTGGSFDPDFERVWGYYDRILELADYWGDQDGQERSKALKKMQDKIRQIESSQN